MGAGQFGWKTVRGSKSPIILNLNGKDQYEFIFLLKIKKKKSYLCSLKRPSITEQCRH